jgi:hypothetical protein
MSMNYDLIDISGRAGRQNVHEPSFIRHFGENKKSKCPLNLNTLPPSIVLKMILKNPI